MEKNINLKNFLKKLNSEQPIYLTRVEREFVLSLLDEIEDYQRILETFDNRKYRNKYLKEERAKRKGLLYPDADEIYMKYFNQRNQIEELKVSCLEKDEIILELHNKIMEQNDISYNMAEYIANQDIDEDICKKQHKICSDYPIEGECEECVIKFFTKRLDKR